MKRSSLIKIIVFSFAIWANIRYLVFLFNPVHIGVPWFYALNLFADLISVVVLTFQWVSCLHFELMRGRYNHEIKDLQEKGKDLAYKKTSILVPCVNEKISVIRKTVEAVLNLKGTKVVYILDDGQRDDVKKLARDLKVHYIRRENRDHFKAGNLNNGLKHVDSEFVAVFDADFVTHESFLMETLPLFIDEKVAAVQTPQAYYNENNLFSRGSKNYQDLFYDYTMPSKHLLNSSFIVGTNVVYRKSALDAIGGIPTQLSHSEDVFTALKLNEKGYNVTYLHKRLAYGLAPDNVISFFNQQYRWARGGFTMLLKHNALFNRKLNLDQKISYFFSNMFYLTGVSLLIYLINPFIAILFNVKPIGEAYFNEWLSAYGLYFVFNFLFYTVLVRKNRLAAMALGMFSFIPLVSALISVLAGRGFYWKTTNFLSKDVVARFLVLLMCYVFTAIALFYLFVSQMLVVRINILWYLVWICFNSCIILYFIAGSYKSVFFNKE